MDGGALLDFAEILASGEQRGGLDRAKSDRGANEQGRFMAG